MSRMNNNRPSLNASGLSRQSTKFYKTVRQKSNLELDKTLKKLNIEHKASISKILQEEYEVKHDHNAMCTGELLPKGNHPSSAWTNCNEDLQTEEGAKIDSRVSIGYAENLESNGEGEKNVLVPETDNKNKSRGTHGKFYSCHLPSIMEETTLGNKCVSQSSRSGRSENHLPPLFENTFPMFPRVHSDHIERQPGRNRSKTISIPDETRARHYMARKRSNVLDYGGVACDPKRKDFDSQNSGYDHVRGGTNASQGWGGGSGTGWDQGLASCRYLRRSHSSPNVLDAESFFK